MIVCIVWFACQQASGAAAPYIALVFSLFSHTNLIISFDIFDVRKKNKVASVSKVRLHTRASTAHSQDYSLRNICSSQLAFLYQNKPNEIGIVNVFGLNAAIVARLSSGSNLS